MPWSSGTMSVEEAVAHITQIAVREVLERANNGNVNITIENDGSYWFHREE